MAKKVKRPAAKTIKTRRPKAVRVPRLMRSVDPQVQQVFLYYRQKLEQTDPAEVQVAFGSVIVKVISSLLRIVETTSGYTPAERKAAVLQMVGEFYDQVFAPLIESKFPFVGKRWIAPAGRELFLDAANGAIDALTDIFNRTGWFDVPSGTNGAHPVPSDPGVQLPDGFVPY